MNTPTAPTTTPQTTPTITEFISSSQQRPDLDTPFALENPYMLELNLRGSAWAKQGSMVAYQGAISFKREGIFSRGLIQLFMGRLTAEGAKLMKVEGTGRVYLADKGKRVQILRLQNEAIFVNGNDVLAFDPTIDSKITMMRSFGASLAGGLFNIRLSGTGNVAITSHHTPLALLVTPNRDVFADPNATVAWSSGLDVSVKTDIQLKTLFGRGSGESIQLRFRGNGWVLIQPYEEVQIKPRAR
ncbi:MAG: AIM24 family protein [Bdellovibrionota bacterium]